METAATALQVAKSIWDVVLEPISYIWNPSKKRKLLENELVKMTDKRDDIKERIEREEVEKRGKRLKQVDGWLNKVDQTKAECDKVLETSWNLRNCGGVGKKIAQLYSDVQVLQTGGNFEEVVTPMPLQIREMPMEKTVGMDSMLSQVWECLEAKEVGIIGLYGMGGVGKTTLLKRINEKFRCTSHGFHVVLWIVVSKQVNLDKIRDGIRRDLVISDKVWSDRSEDARASELCRVLNGKKFVLLIDDIWERLDLSRIGIPIPNQENGSKIVFTTRFEELCGQMEANKSIRVQCLTSEEALELFQKKVGQATLDLHPNIPRVAELIVQECKGLPLALITVGRAMATRKNLREWEHALNVLRNYPSKFSRMVDDVYILLEFSYHSLKDSTLQKCFLYCALFPEDYNINMHNLIDLWIGEGFLFDTNDTYEARLEIESVIRRLKSACLLESGKTESEVKMHDVIRDMALWLAREHGERENKIIVVEEDLHISRWKEAERISLQGQGLNHVTELPVCSNLITLLINETELENLPEGFYNSMLALRVLDMCVNSRFNKLPTGIGQLVKLQYLNLSYTRIKVLPNEMKHLTSLLYLLLDYTENLVDIPKEVISSFLSLKVFRKCGDWTFDLDERGLVEGLEGLHQLDELSLGVYTAFSVHKLLESPNLQRSITHLTINNCSDLTAIKIPSSSLRKMLRLNRLELNYCDSLKSIEIYEDGKSMIPRQVNGRLSRGPELANLHHVNIYGSKLRNLSWLIYAPNLQTLRVRGCYTLEKILDEDILQHVDETASARFFSSLISLKLNGLPRLRSIHNRTLSSPSLTWIVIEKCPSLKKLPFDSNSGKNSLKRVKADPRWWHGLEWDDETAKAFFTSKLGLI